MADSKRVQRSIKQLQRIKTWQLVILLILMSFVTATFLRLNNIGMVQRRDAVLAADKEASSEILINRLYDLQRYSTSHMNASTGNFYLEEQYYRDVAKIKEVAKQDANNPHANINKKVDDEICGPLARANNWRYPDIRYTNCLTEELAKYPEASLGNGQATLPSPDAFRHSFASPRWSPDFAGFSLLVTLVIVVMIIARFLSLMILKLLLRQHFRRI